MTRLSISLTALILICFCFLPLTVAAQKIDFSDTAISEPVYVKFWKLQIQDTLRSVEIDSALILPEVIFHDPINFSTARFDSTADFRWATFESTAYFIGVTFNSIADFRRATFDTTADFDWATFDSRADFSEATFEGTADFEVVTFDAMADFSRATFEDRASFLETKFESTADFCRATFDSTAGFSWATFEGRASFRETKFKSTVAFRWATFEKAVDFRGTEFLGKVNFGRAKLPDSIDFRNLAEISREIDFTYCLPPDKGRKCRIALKGTDISKIKLNMNLFELSFPEETVQRPSGKADTIYRESLDAIYTVVREIVDTIIYPTYDQQCSIYEQVLKKLENDGFRDSYEILDVQYRQFKYYHKWYGSVVNALHKIWWNYGYDKERILFIWTPLFFIVFAFLNLLFWYGTLSDEVYTIAFLEKIPHAAGRMKRAAKKVLQVMAYTGIVFFSLKMDVSKFKKGVVRQHPWLFTYLMSIYVVGLICLGFIVNIIFTR